MSKPRYSFLFLEATGQILRAISRRWCVLGNRACDVRLSFSLRPVLWCRSSGRGAPLSSPAHTVGDSRYKQSISIPRQLFLVRTVPYPPPHCPAPRATARTVAHPRLGLRPAISPVPLRCCYSSPAGRGANLPATERRLGLPKWATSHRPVLKASCPAGCCSTCRFSCCSIFAIPNCTALSANGNFRASTALEFR